jgi:MFS transporter, FHS family, L-fucose permease
MDEPNERSDMSQTTEPTRINPKQENMELTAGSTFGSSVEESGAKELAVQKNYNGSMALLTSLFFMWGFLTVMNDILIPYLKKAFELSYFQAMFVQFAFFAAYFVGSLIYFLISITKGDPIAKIGYQNGIVLGLVISGSGALLFYPAAQLLSYPFFLGALFILALGFTMLQISANPFVAILGSERTASSRLNLSQGFNSLGTTIAPLIGGYLIFNYFASENSGADSVQIPYLIFASALFALAIVFFFVKLPKIQSAEGVEKSAVAFRFRHVSLGMVAIACYVGAEVSIGSLLISYLQLPAIAGISEEAGSIYVAIYWGGLMIGRFLGAISQSRLASSRKVGLMVLSALGSFGLIFLAICIKDDSFLFAQIWPFTILIALNFGAFFVGRFVPSRTLAVFSVCCVALLLTTVFSSGPVAMWAVLGIGLFNSIMWSNIFTLSIEGLGKYKSQASSLLVMMIIGGALFPPAQGLAADLWGIQLSFLLPVVAYLYLAFYGLRGHVVVEPEIKTQV